MKRVQRNIDVIATFCAGKPPQPHRFRVRDRYDNVHVYRIGQILRTTREKILGYDVWRYECQGRIGDYERKYTLQYNIEKALWQLVKV